MPRGRTYELRAVFSAENKAGRTIGALERRLESLQGKIDKLSRQDADIGISEHGAAETGARIDEVERKVKQFDGMDAEADVGISEKEIARSQKRLADLDRRIKTLTNRPNQIDIDADIGTAERRIREIAAEARDLSRKAYNMEIRAEADNLPRVMQQARELKEMADRVNGQRMQLIADIRGVPKVIRDAGLVKIAMEEVEGTYTVKVDTRSLITARGAGMALMSVFKNLGGALSRMQPISQSFAQKVYIMQQAMSVFRVALMAVAVAAAGPLVAGLTILGASLIAAAGGFGVVALAAAPIIAYFMKARQRAQDLEQAQSDLDSAQDQLATSSQAVADAQRGVGEAYRSGQEAIRGAIQSHADALRGVTEAQRAYKDAQQGVGEAELQAHEQVVSAIQAHKDSLVSLQDAQRSYADAQEAARDATQDVRFATQEYNTALATEQFRLRSMQLDVAGMRLSQKQLAFDMREARRELEKAENPRDRQEAQLRLQQLELQRKQNILDMGQAQRELNQAQRKGTDELQSAADARKQAMDAQKEAQQGVVDALRDVVAAQKESAQSERDIAKARREGNRQIREAQQTANDAKRAVQDAMRDERRAQKEIGKARAEAARQMAEANRQLAQANKDMADAQDDVKSKQSALNALLAKTPRHLQQMQKAINGFKNQYKESFKQAQVSTANLGTHLIKIGTNTLPMLGVAADKTAQGLDEAISDIGRNFRKFGAIESLHRILKSMPGITKDWTTAIGNFGGAFLNIMGEAMPFARRLAQAVRETSKNFLEWTNSEKGRKQIRRFFESAAPVAKALWEQIKRIGGALLRWTTQSKKGPERVAAAIKTIGNIIMGTVHAVRTLINVWKALPRPIQETIEVVALLWIGLRILFGSRLLALIARAGFALGKFAFRFGLVGRAAAGAARFAALALGPQGLILVAVVATVAAVADMFRYLKDDFFPKWSAGLRSATGQKHLGGAIRFGLTHPLKPVPEDVRKTLEESLMSAPGILGQATRLGISIRNAIISGLSKLNPQLGGVLKDAYGIVDKNTDKMSKTAKTNTGEASKGMRKNFSDAKGGVTKSTSTMSTDVQADLHNIRQSAINNSQDAQKASNKNLKDMQQTGSDNMRELFKNSDFNLGKMKGASNDHTEKMKNVGIENFTDFNKGGTKNSEELKAAAMERMFTMQTKVNKSTHTTMEKGVADLVDMQERGTGAMSDAQESWVSTAWDTSVQTQQSFNAILEGMSRFIEKADIDMKKPKQFSPVFRKGGDISGNGNLHPNPKATGVAQGGVFRYASGGEHAPVGGIAEGTTRIVGEIPGTTEFYITDNKKYRDRNMQILAEANRHMAAQFASGGKWPPKSPAFRSTGGDGRVDYHASRNAARTARAGAALWRGLVHAGGRDVGVTRSRNKLGGHRAAFTTTGGRVVYGPGADLFHAGHEFGHTLGLGHGGNGIMGGRGRNIGGPSRGDFAAIKAYYGAASGGGGGGHHRHHGGSGDGGSSGMTRADKRRAQVQARREQAEDARADRREARRFRRRFNRNPNTHGPLGDVPDYSRNALWMSAGGAMHAPNNMRYTGKPVMRGLRGNSVEQFATGGQWYPKTAEIREEVRRKLGPWAHGTRASTYPGHGADGDPRNSVDFFVGPYNAAASGKAKAKGDEILNYMLDTHRDFTDYLIWWHDIYDSGGRSRYTGGGGYGRANHSDPDQAHTNHVHWESLENNPGPSVMGGMHGSSGPSREELMKQFNKYVPIMGNVGYGLAGNAAETFGMNVRSKLFEKAMNNAGTTDFSGGKSPKGLTMMEAITSGGFPKSKRDTAIGVAWEESGGRANAKNPSSSAYGLFQFLKSTAQGMGLSYKKMGDPIYASKAANTLSKQGHDWSPWAAYPPSKSSMNMGDRKITGYSNGGLVTRPHLGLIGDTGPEVNMPLNDPRAMNMIRRAFDMSDRVSAGAMHRNKAIGEAVGSSQRIDQSTGTNVDKRIEQALDKAQHRTDNALEQAFERVGDKLDNRIKELIQKEMEISEAMAEKLMRAGAKVVLDILQHPHIGGDIVNEHIARDVEYETELTKR